MTTETLYIKPVVCGGVFTYYLGWQPSNRHDAYAFRLGQYFFRAASFSEALKVAQRRAEEVGADIDLCDIVEL